MSQDIGGPSLLEPDRAQWLWTHLRARIPTALSCVLMPEHLHMVAPPGQQSIFRGVLGGFYQCFGTRFSLKVQVVNSPEIAIRTVRYTLLNPVRAKLVHDLWLWQWSSLREIAGLAYPPWMRATELAKIMHCSPDSLLQSLTHTADSRPPIPVPSTRIIATPEAVIEAVAVVLRQPTEGLLQQRLARRLAVQACRRLGSATVPTLAEQLGISRKSVRNLQEPQHPALDAVMFCLSDSRLIHPWRVLSARSC